MNEDEAHDSSMIARSIELTKRGVLLAATAGLLTARPSLTGASEPLEALAFDGFPIFDPRSITALARDLFPAKGEALASLWTSKLFGYTWLVTAGEKYLDFEALADASLRFAAESLHLELAASARAHLLGAYSQLAIWPDVEPALAKLKHAGIRLGFLSNLGEAALRANMERSGIQGYFEQVLSTDRVRRFKPSPIAYRMALDAFGLPKDKIGFVAFGGWDAVGASWFGYRTAWVNRLGQPPEPLDARSTVVTPGIEGALTLAGIA